MGLTKINGAMDILEFASYIADGDGIQDTANAAAGLELGLLLAEKRPDVAAEILSVMRQPIGGEPFREELDAELRLLGVEE